LDVWILHENHGWCLHHHEFIYSIISISRAFSGATVFIQLTSNLMKKHALFTKIKLCDRLVRYFFWTVHVFFLLCNLNIFNHKTILIRGLINSFSLHTTPASWSHWKFFLAKKLENTTQKGKNIKNATQKGKIIKIVNGQWSMICNYSVQ